MSLRSMTGYARVRRSTALGDVTFSVRSVNHRGLDLHFALPPAVEPYEPALRAVLKASLLRGHVNVQVMLDKPRQTTGAGVNRELLAAYSSAFQALKNEFGFSGEPDLNVALRLPGMLTAAPAAEPDASVERDLVAALKDALGELNEARSREGLAILADMQQRQRALFQAGQKLEGLRSTAVEAIRRRVEQRLAELQIKLDPARVAQEAALLAERSDIAEEITRLRTHVEQLGTLLKAGGEVGKKLDFLLQELNREANTMLAKTANSGEAGLAITEIALGLKAEIEKIREQSLNVE